MEKKRIAALLLAALLLTGTLFAGIPVFAEKELTTSDEGIAVLKALEGFIKYPIWDVTQYAVGYGTRVPDEDLERIRAEGITEEEGEALLRYYLEDMEASLNRFAQKNGLKLSQNQFDALMLFTYNCGPGWMSSTGYTFRTAVLEGWTGEKFLQTAANCSHAGGKIMTHLIVRRLAEANIYLNGVYGSGRPADFCYVLLQSNGDENEESVLAFFAQTPPSTMPTAKNGSKKLLGWYTEKENGTKVSKIDASLCGKTLYAHWGASETQEPVPTDELREVTVSSSLNVREEPTTKSAVLRTLRNHSVVHIVAEQTNQGTRWGKLENGGWISLSLTKAYEEKPEKEPEKEPETVQAVINTNNLRIRAGASTSTAEVGRLMLGASVGLTEQKTVDGIKWGKLADGRGWICMSYGYVTVKESTTPSSGGTKENAVVKTDNLRIRSGAGTSTAQVGLLQTGDRIEITEQKTVSGMLWGRLGDGRGWVCMSYGYVSMEQQETPKTPKEPEKPQTPETPGSTGANATVRTSNLRIRSGASTSAAQVGLLQTGDRIGITEQKTVSGMLWGRLGDGRGWVCMSYGYVTMDASTPSGEQKKTVTVTADCLNIRAGAGTGYALKGQLSYGTRVTVTKTEKAGGMTWGKLEDGRGWISLTYTK